MSESVWGIWADRGFLCKPDPLLSLVETMTDVTDQTMVRALEESVARLPALLLHPDELHWVIDSLALLTRTDFADLTPPQAERLLQLYSFLATAYIYADPEQPLKHLPVSIARPFVELAALVERPPMFSYTSLVLANWRRIDPLGEITVDNLETLSTFTGLPDERWFALIHVDIEARAAGALRGALDAAQAVIDNDADRVTSGLRAIYDGLRAMMKTFRRMRSGCDPDVYYQQIRPYNFGFINVVYEGSRFGDTPQNFRGGSGAQSSVIPALVAALGVQHEATDLMVHLNAMHPYMPRPHREFIHVIGASGIRAFVQRVHSPALTDAYNDCLRALTLFRQLHLSYAKLYIFERGDPVGTGGTPFMDWLNKLIDETEKQYV